MKPEEQNIAQCVFIYISLENIMSVSESENKTKNRHKKISDLG